MNKLAVLILTYNEEVHIEKCIESAKFADEIIVIDSGSTDKTVEIAKGKGARVVHHPMTEGFAAQRNFAYSCTDAEWVLYLDADERITPELAEEIRQVMGPDKTACYQILRRNIAFNQLMNYGVCRPDYTLRLFPRDSVVWEGKVHEAARTSLRVRKLKNHMYHYTYTSWDKYFQKLNHYTTLWAEDKFSRGKKATVADVFLHPAYAFFQIYFIKLGILDGLLGLVLSVFHIFYTMAKYTKLYYRNKRGEYTL